MPSAASSKAWLQRSLVVLSWLGILAMIAYVLSGALAHPMLLGAHDWDQMQAHRYLVVKTLKEFGQFPFWNPYSCGGHPNWAGVESGVTIVSPFLPAYLLFSLPVAIRIELVGAALLSAGGTWLFAGRFTRSAALRALVCAMFVVNGRWALQTAVGHTWHLYYAWTPWVLYFADRALTAERTSRMRFWGPVLAGGAIAMMVYMGGIYPLPQTAFILGLYASVVAIRLRTLRPLGVVLVAGLCGFGFSALKLLPILDVLRLYPRLIESTEAISLNTFVQAFTAPMQTVGSRPAEIPQWGWHEYGIYIGWIPFLLLFLGLTAARGTRESSLKWCGALCLLLGFGAFHPYAPWTLAHELPIFASQHVPVRWQHPAALLLGVAAAAAGERLLRRLHRTRPILEIALLALFAFVGYDIAENVAPALRGAFYRAMPTVQPRDFRQYFLTPPDLKYRDSDWAPPALPAMMAGVGIVDCSTFPAFHGYVRGTFGRAKYFGATGLGDPNFRGETYVVSGEGAARISTFTPNRITVTLKGARVGDLAVLNQNWDSGWTADGRPAVNYQDTLASPIREPNQVIEFSYRPRSFWLAWLVFIVTAAVVGVAARRAARRRDGLQGT